MTLPARARIGVALGLALCAVHAAHAADAATGALDYKGRSTTLRYAWLVTGPSDMEPGRTVRRVVLSAHDIGAKLQACTTFSCTDGMVTEGATLDFTGGARIAYWIALGGQKVQYSGTALPSAFAARVDDASHLAGGLAIDDTAAGGPKLQADFDVARLKAFTVAR